MKKFILLLLALVMLVSFAACGGNTDDPEGDQDNKPTTDVSGKTDGKKDDDDEDFKVDIKDDGNTVTWKIGTITFVFKHDGTNVTAYSQYMEMETVDEAKDMMDIYEYTKAAENDDCKSITRKGSVVIIEYNESAFPYTTYEELKSVAEIFKSFSENQ